MNIRSKTMKKSILPIVFTITASATLGAFPLEWNVNNKTNVPYEVEISRTKLEELAGVSKNCGFEVTATTGKGKKQLEVTMYDGKRQGSVALRFNVPAGTSALDCRPVGNGKFSSIGKLNLFDGVLSDTKAWKANRQGVITKLDGKLKFKARNFGETLFTCTVNVPAEYAGAGAKLELDFKSTAKEAWPGFIYIEQLDAKGKVLPESLTDPRWTTLMRPFNTLTAHRESGRFHSQVKKLRLVIRARGIKHAIGSDGLPVKDAGIFIPEFEISRLSVRAAEEIPFPKYRDEFFSKGVSGKKGDYSFDTTKGKTGKAFFFATHSQACWAEGKTITDPQELFYPAGDGTIETWVKPIWSKSMKRSDWRYIFSADPAQFKGPMRAPGGRTKPCLAVKYFPQAKYATVEFQDYTKKIYKNKFNCEIPSKAWSHVAVQYGTGRGM